MALNGLGPGAGDPLGKRPKPCLMKRACVVNNLMCSQEGFGTLFVGGLCVPASGRAARAGTGNSSEPFLRHKVLVQRMSNSFPREEFFKASKV